MDRYELRLEPVHGRAAASFSLEAPDLRIALVVADINLFAGSAEIWQADRRLARMRKRTGTAQAYWELR